MMKKLLFLVLTLISTSAIAQTFSDNGINYNITDAINFKVEVGNNASFTGVANIPEIVNNGGQNYEVTSIGNNAFQFCGNLTSITIPNSVATIGNGAFWSCNSLTTINIPNSVTSIGNESFFYCLGLTTIAIPDSVISVGYSAFKNCENLMSVTIGNSVTTMGYSVFQHCYDLTAVTFGNSLTSIPNAAFNDCTSLISLTIPNSVTSIGAYAFRICQALTSITIPNSVTSIGDNAFFYCTSLTTVNCYTATPLVINQAVFQNVNQATCTLNVPVGTETAYDAAAVWTNFASINGVLLSSGTFLKNSFSMYPNPSNGMVNISLENNLQLQKVIIYNQLGQVVKTATTHVISTSELAKGAYFVEVITIEGKGTKQLIIE
jgi:hypothetical protein